MLQPDGSTADVDIDDVEVGDVVVVRPGDAIPVDGVVATGTGYADEAAITGESRAVSKEADTPVYSGTILSDGYLQIRATKVGDDTTFAKIVELVEDAQDTKSHAEKFIDRFAQYYTPAVLVIAAVVLLASRDLRLAITVLVLGCLARWSSVRRCLTWPASATVPSAASSSKAAPRWTAWPRSIPLSSIKPAP